MTFDPTPEQQRVLAHDVSRHARLLAGPGTGKSATLVALLNDLLNRVDPPRVRLLTFTRAATGELAEKVAEHPAAAALRPSTVHSFAISVLVRNPGAGGLPAPLRIADDWEYKNIVKPTLARRLGTTPTVADRLVREMAANWESLAEGRDERIPDEVRALFLGAWTEHRRVFGYTLLQELPYSFRRALLDHDDLAGLDWELLIVDEYQDLNACDLEVLRLLGDRGCVVIGAGDDDQSIYSFRKAAPEGIRRFLDDYADASDYTLSVTKRCGRRIVEWANYVIGGDPDRPVPRVLVADGGAPDGEVALLRFATNQAEAGGIAKITARLIEEGIEPSEILILIRGDHNAAFGAPIKRQLEALGIAYADPEWVSKLLGEDENRRFLAALRLTVNREDSLAWATLFDLERGIGTSMFDWLYDNARAEGRTLGTAVVEKVEAGFDGGPGTTSRIASELVTRVLRWLEVHPVPEDQDAWGAWMIEQADDDAVPTPTEELRKLLLELDALSEAEDLGRYIGQIQPLAKDLASSRSAGVRIMSMASAKGLTVEATIIGAVENEVIPRPGADVHEERRLLYVALTRAKSAVYATWAQRRTGPSARAGGGQAMVRRSYSDLLYGGPVSSEDGAAFIARRW